KYAEVRWIRAFNYYVLANEFGNVPFLTKISGSAAPRATQPEMYKWLISEFTECEKDLMDAVPVRDTDKEKYGRVNKAAAWLMLSRLYLNANVWNANEEGFDYNEALENAKKYAKMVLESDYKLCTGKTDVIDLQTGVACTYTGYDKLFMADNGESEAYVEAILPLLQDGEITRGYGGSYFFVAAHADAEQKTVNDIDKANTDGWRGMRVRKQLLEKFTNDPYAWEGKTSKEIRAVAGDDRALFWGVEHTADITSNDKDESFLAGLTTTKFNNRRSDGKNPKRFDGNCDADFFLLRAAEAYLNYAEAEARLNGGSLKAGSEGAKCLDAIRDRAHCTKKMTTYSLNDILDERAREFYCEGYRRTDLIRFGQFGGNGATYTWDYKGGIEAGQAFPATRNLYPIPSSELLANPNLKQNEGYTEAH
ncbi:MAG: RagB/SusD family nutrient uptake outer membrane protein, partial [Paludibacteraceae bacterium]|nr:RagB/SusD family nutrient uptake outer membrane protein [Paludibacteraceae bacterium]